MKLYSLHDSSTDRDDDFIQLAAQTYGINIHVHGDYLVKTYHVECDCPIVHLMKFQIDDDLHIYLATGKIEDQNEIGDAENDKIELFTDLC
jgi:hypothetical protein